MIMVLTVISDNTITKHFYKIYAAEILDNLQKAVLFDIAQRQAWQSSPGYHMMEKEVAEMRIKVQYFVCPQVLYFY